LGSGCRLVKTAPKSNIMKQDQHMADDKVHPTATEMDYPAHFRNYDGFIKLFKYGMVVTAIIAAIVIFTISN
jgi:hypothetical protein